MKVCIVGCGKLAHARAEVIKRQKNFHIAAVVDPDLENALSLVEEYGGRNRPKALAALDDPRNYNLAIIQSPNGLHRSCAEPFIEEDIPVVIEKPLALAAEDLNWFADKADEGRWICGSYNSRFSPDVNAAVMSTMADVAAGYSIVTLESSKFRHRGPSYYQDGWHGTLAMDGGVLAQQAIHCIDLVCWAADIPPLRASSLGFRHKHNIECEDTGTVMIDFGDFCGIVSGTTAAGRPGPATFLSITTRGIYADSSWGWDDGAEILWEKIASALYSGFEPPVTVKSMLPSLRVLHAAYVSVENSGDWKEIGVAHPKLGVA